MKTQLKSSISLKSSALFASWGDRMFCAGCERVNQAISEAEVAMYRELGFFFRAFFGGGIILKLHIILQSDITKDAQVMKVYSV